jgi:hypothetical protein
MSILYIDFIESEDGIAIRWKVAQKGGRIPNSDVCGTGSEPVVGDLQEAERWVNTFAKGRGIPPSSIKKKYPSK